MTHDFNKAIKSVQACISDDEDGAGYLFDSMNGPDGKAVIFALKFAQKMMGEPSHAMCEEGYSDNDHERILYPSACFKAMRDQTIKEVEDEN